MTSPKLLIPLVTLIFSLNQTVFSQTGPGGVGNSTGSSGQPYNVLWLKAGSGVTQSGTVDSWADQSGNLLLATGSGGTRPSFIASDANFNNQPVIDFSATGTNKHLVIADNDILDNTTGFSLFVVFRTNLTAGNYALLSKRTTVGVDQSYMTWVNAGQLSSRAAANTINGGTINNTTSYIGSTIYNGSSSTVSNFVNGVSASSGAAPTSIPNNASNLFIGAFDVSGGETRNLDGRIAEALVYASTLNEAQRQIVENYLAAKYNLSLTGDVYSGDGSGFDFDVIGIGRASGASHTEASSAGMILSTYNGSLDANGEFLMAGRGAAANSVVNCACAGFPGSIQQRWARTWFIDKTTAGSLDAAVAFDFSDGISGLFPQDKDDYELLYSSDGGTNFSIVSIASGDKSIVGDRMTFRVANASLLDGIYTIGTRDAIESPINGAANRTWYSYQTGNWENPTSWTLDGGVLPLYVNPGAETPSASDNVVVTSGRTITLTSNNQASSSLEVNGVLNVASTSGHSFVTIAGTGRIRISGAGGLDNFPSGSTTAFSNATTGGTVEVYGTGMVLSQTNTFNDLIINLTSGTASLTASSLTLNGDLAVENGTLRFNDGVVGTASNLTVNGNITIESAGLLTVSTSNLRHQLNLLGNFANNGGTVQFTNRTSPAIAAYYTAEATDGIVDFNLLNDTQNQTITCNGITRFYRIEIDKGTDDTYLATFTANALGNFLLYGYANDNDGSIAQLTSSNNSFTLLRGTAEIRSNISIPVLSNNGNYNISVGAMLWVNGGTVLKNNGNSTVPYGKLKVTSGLFESKVSAGITTRDNGTIIVEGGVVNTNQIRTSVLGASNVGGYVQTGGAVTVDGGGPGGTGLDYYVFSLTYPGNVFQMSGGTLTVKGYRAGTAGTRGAIFINSDPSNVSVTGGTVIAEISNSNINDPGNLPAHDSSAYVITSRAPFWNLVLRNTLASTLIRQVDLLGGTSGPAGGGADEVTLPAQNLVIKGGLTIESKVKLDHNGKNISLAGNLVIQDKADLLFSNNAARRNTTTLDGTDNATLSFLNRNDGNGEQRFWNLVINKPSDKVVSLASSKTDLTGSNNNLLRIDGNAFKLLSGTLDQGFHSVRMYCDTVLNYQTLGVFNGATTDDGTVSNDRNDMIKFRDDNTPTTLLTTNSSVFGVVRLNSGDDPIALRSNVYIKFLQYLYGKINLGSYNLKIDQVVGGLINPAQLPPRGLEADSLGLQTRAFSVEDMLVTNGAASDGGLSLRISGNGVYKFPLGLGLTADDNTDNSGTDIYTPAQVTVSGFSDDGYITINTVNSTLQTTNLSGGADILNYYWRVRYEGFTTRPTVKYQFTYDQSDVGGTETNYVPGKVLDINPFTRSSEAASVNTTKNIIHFDGTGAGFTLEQANYTAGASTRFTGTPTVYYSRVNSGNWNVNSTWSLTRGGAAAASVPGPGDIVIMRRTGVTYSGVVTIPSGYTANAAQVLFDDENGFSSGCPRIIFQTGTPFSSNLGTIEVAATHQGGTLSGDIHGAVLQYNVDNTYSGVFPSGDFGGFNNYLNALVIYEWQSGTGTITLSSSATEYPQLWFQNGSASRIIKFPNVDVTVKGRAYITGGNQVMTNDGASSVTLNFQRNLEIGSGCCGGGTFLFPGVAGANQTVQVDGNILSTTGGSRNISILNAAGGTRQHNLIVKGNIDIVTGATMNLGSGSASQTNVSLELQGVGNNTFANAGTVTIPRIIMNKGNDVTSSFSFNNNFTLTGATNLSTKAITLQNGLLILNNSAINVVLSSGGGDFSIPASAGLEARAGTVNVTGSDTGLLLDGYLLVSGGTVNIDDAVGNGNNFIEYSASGSAILQITSGTLTVGSQIRRGLTSTAGILKYRQSNGAVVVGRRAAPTTNRGVFEIVNTGSEFTHTAGTLTIVRGINSTTVPSLLLEPQTPTAFSSSNIIIGSANTPSGVNGQNIGIKADARRLGTLTISNASGNSPKALIYSAPLDIEGTFTIENGASFDAKGLGLTLRGNFVVNGTFIPNGNTVTLSPGGPRAISGSGVKTFYNLTKSNSNSNSVSLSGSIEVLNDLRIQRGSIADNGNTITLRGNAYFGFSPSTSGSHSSTLGGEGIVFAGASQQQLFALRTDGTASVGTITIDNPSGVIISDQSDKFTVSTELRLKNGVLDIGGSLLTLATSAEIEEVNLFSVTNMIQTNSSFTDNGMTKVFASNRTADFIFPIGQLLYTPVTLDFADLGPGTGSGSTPPSITVRPANERQPIIQEDVESGACGSQIDDPNNVLQYHWIITASNATNLESNVTLQYNQSLVSLANGNLESDYIAARVRTSDNTVFKFPIGSVNDAANTISFEFNNVNSSEISGEYLAGINCAIPDDVLTYTTLGGGSGTGSISDLGIYSGSPVSLPAGVVLVVSAGDVVDIDVDNVSLYRTEIYGTLRVLSGTIGNRLGTVVGDGTLRLEVNSPDLSVVLPAGFYNDFFNCTGGGLELGGNTGYEILGGITSLRRLTIDGTGTRSLANNDLLICEDFTVNGASFTNPNNRNITVQGDLIISSGTFASGVNNTIEVIGDLLVNGGVFNGQTEGNKIINGNLSVSSGTFDAGSGGTLTLLSNVSFTGGTFTGGTGTHKTLFQGTSTQTTLGSITLNQLEIDNGFGLSMGGNVSINDQLLLTNGNIVPGANNLFLALGATAVPTEGRVTSFVDGKLYKALGAGGAPTSANTFTFPIGSGTRWRSGSISVASGTAATWDMQYFEGNADTQEASVTNLTPIAPVVRIASGEYWKLSDGNVASTGRTATVGLSWGIESDVNASSVERQDLRVMQWVGAPTNQWQNRGGTNFSGGNTQSRGTFNASATISFSEQIVTLGSVDASNPLPVEIVSFSGVNQNGFNKLDWKTASELNNDYFELQRSNNGEVFSSIGKMNGKGTTNSLSEYTFMDEQPFGGNNYYRLKQVDFNGVVSYSNIILVKNEQGDVFNISVFPNPVSKEGSFTIRSIKDDEYEATIVIMDMTGRTITSYTINGSGSFEQNVDLSAWGEVGIYLVEMRQGSKRVFKRLMLN